MIEKKYKVFRSADENLLAAFMQPELTGAFVLSDIKRPDLCLSGSRSRSVGKADGL